jgi:hypothetical protein
MLNFSNPKPPLVGTQLPSRGPYINAWPINLYLSPPLNLQLSRTFALSVNLTMPASLCQGLCVQTKTTQTWPEDPCSKTPQRMQEASNSPTPTPTTPAPQRHTDTCTDTHCEKGSLQWEFTLVGAHRFLTQLWMSSDHGIQQADVACNQSQRMSRQASLDQACKNSHTIQQVRRQSHTLGDIEALEEFQGVYD